MVPSGAAVTVFWRTVVIFASIFNCVFADEEYTEYSRHLRHHVQRRNVQITSKFDRKLRIVTILTQPYTLISKKAGDGNNKYIGMIPDLMFQLSRRLGFEYEIYLVPDGMYGALVNVTTGEWTGMIGEVIKNDKNRSNGADIAAGPITVTSMREKVVNFVKPFMHSSISIVVKRPGLDASSDFDNLPYYFSIFQPFDVSVWGLIALSVVVVGLFLWLMNMFNPYEWAGHHKRGMADKRQSEAFNLAGSMWFVLTSLQWQGFEKAPRSIASRLLGCVWFAFVSIVLMAYTAGIVNHLFWASMVHRDQATVATGTQFQDLAHLLMDKEFRYVTLSGGSTYEYVTRVATGKEFGIVRQHLRSPEGYSVHTTHEGMEKVRTGKYAFFTETATAKFYANKKPCDLTTVGEPFAKRGYGLALPLNSAFLEELDVAILEMIEEGDMEELENRWWIGDDECWNVTDRYRRLSTSDGSAANDPMSVDMQMFRGPFLMVAVGVFAGLIVAVVEMLYYRQWGRHKTCNQPQGQQLKMDTEERNI